MYMNPHFKSFWFVSFNMSLTCKLNGLHYTYSMALLIKNKELYCNGYIYHGPESNAACVTDRGSWFCLLRLSHHAWPPGLPHQINSELTAVVLAVKLVDSLWGPLVKPRFYFIFLLRGKMMFNYVDVFCHIEFPRG